MECTVPDTSWFGANAIEVLGPEALDSPRRVNPRTQPKTPGKGAGKAGRPVGSVATCFKRKGKGQVCRRKPVPTQDKFCQVCYRLAPPVPAGQKRGYKWRQRFATTKGVRLDAHCNLRMCDRCFSDNWDHDSQCLKAGAKRHYTPKSGAG